MISPLQANYAAMLTLVSRMIDQLSGVTLAPVDDILGKMSSLPQWGRMDDSLHSLPSEYICGRNMNCSFILPAGEHMLKIVEQLEIVLSTATDLLGAFLPSSQKDQNAEWRNVLTEMMRYGDQKEKAVLGKADLTLKIGLVKRI
jgi:hypothetical protein